MNNLAQTLSSLSDSLPGLLPELALAVLFVLVVLADLLFYHDSRKLSLTGVGLVIVLYLVYRQGVTLSNAPTTLFLGLLRLDGLAVFLKGIAGLAGLLIILLSLLGKEHRQQAKQAEWLAPFIALILGAHFLVMSTSLLMLYISLELVSLSSYILTAYNRDASAAEGGIKYLLFGAISSAVMLYGMSWLYGFTGSLHFTEPAFYQSLAQIPSVPLLIAVFLTLGGLLFKVSAVPFHVWTPDVYQAAPLPVAAFFSVAPKAAGIGVLLRLVGGLDRLTVADFTLLQNGLCVIILLTLTVGNFAALWQQNVRRMLAYSSIAHAGFLLIGVVAGGSAGVQSLLFYLAIYVCMNIAAFLLVDILSRRTGSEQIDTFAGMGTQLPFVGVATVISMVALAGLPPTAGFTAKLLIFSALWQAYQISHNGWLLVVFGVGLLQVAVSLFYYLKMPYYLFFRPGNELKQKHLGMYEGGLIVILVVPVVLLFFRADWLLQVITILLK